MWPNTLVCPICQSSLAHSDKSLHCANGHNFDQAKQGYWNLLPVQQKRSKQPGDNSEMVSARRQFLAANHYATLRDRVAALCAQVTEPVETPNVIDIGCGEGYYTQAIGEELAAQHALIGLDISKPAIKAACSRSKNITWLVASGAQIPVAAQSQDLLVLMFSRLMPEPFHKVLKPQAKLIMVWPAEKHLIELRQAIYDEVKTSRYDPQALLQEQFQLEHQEQLEYKFTLSEKTELDNLLAMTPHSQRISQEKHNALFNQLPISLTLDVNVGVFSPR